MNNNLILLTYLLSNKKSKLFQFNNYFYKLLYILDFNNYWLNIKSKIFKDNYKTFYQYKYIIKKFKLKYQINEIYKNTIININKDNQIKLIPKEINILINLKFL
jgi:hypothetical protein